MYVLTAIDHNMSVTALNLEAEFVLWPDTGVTISLFVKRVGSTFPNDLCKCWKTYRETDVFRRL